jgi:hypothetical protein
MNRKWIFSAVTAATLTVACALVAQEPPAEAPPPPPAFGHGGPMGGRMEILGFREMHPGKVVTGAPYSAVSVTETTQTLADGTSINRKIQANVFRDSQGRMRKEITLPAIGPLAAGGQTKSFVLIHDPVAGATYELRPELRTATKLPVRQGSNRNSDKLQSGFEAHVQQEIANGTLKKEDLGTQTVNGVSAQGTRYTRTIPAGQIGNDKPISIVNEQWYSPDLQMVVKSTRTDPRSGSSTYMVTNIQRQEPAASLFAVPADYAVTPGHSGPHGGKGGYRNAPAGQAPTSATPPAQ